MINKTKEYIINDLKNKWPAKERKRTAKKLFLQIIATNQIMSFWLKQENGRHWRTNGKEAIFAEPIVNINLDSLNITNEKSSKKEINMNTEEKLSLNEKIEQLDQANKLVRDYVIADDLEKQEVLNVLQKVNGFEKGLIDFYGYYVSGNYNYTPKDIVEEIKEEYDLRDEDLEELSSSKSSNSL